MSVDVCQKIKENNDIHNGYVVTGVLKTGRYKTLEPKINKTRTIDDMEARYTNRFDNVGYYS